MDTIRRNGGMRIELLSAIRAGDQDIDALEIRPFELDHTIRWGRGEITSTLGLLAELTGVPEAALRRISQADVDRVMLAFCTMMPAKIREDFEAGSRPLATPGPNDLQTSHDPRFPQTDEPVVPFDNGFSADPPGAATKVA